MRRLTTVITCVLLVIAGTSVWAGDTAQATRDAIKGLIDAGSADAKLKTFAVEKLLPVCVNPVIVSAVKEQNAKQVAMDQIRQLDAAWTASKDLPLQKEMLGNACAKELIAIVQANPAIVEVFVMDNQGANVGQNALTSDYWQGDEPKWTKSFNEGKGGVDVGEPKLDKSAGKVLQQISLPMIDADGSVVGAVTFGVAVEQL